MVGAHLVCLHIYHSVYEDTAVISNKGAPGTTTPWNSSDVNSQVFSEVDSLDLRWTLGCSKVLYGSILCNFMASFYIHAAKHMIKQKTSLLLWPIGPIITAIWKTMHLAPAKSYNSQLSHAFTKLLGTILS